MTDALSAAGIWGALCFVVSLALISTAISRFRLDPQSTGLKNYGAWIAWLVACLALLFVSDFLLHHARIVFFLFVAFWTVIGLTEPHVGMEMGLLVLALLSAQVASSFESFTENDLMRAIQKGKVEAALDLIRGGADVNVADSYGSTPLMASVHSKNNELVTMLLQVGANPNAADSQGSTALSAAAFHGQTELVKILIQAGAHVNARTSGGNSALKWASMFHYEEIAALLRNAGANEEPEKS